MIEVHESTSMGWMIGWPIWIVGLLILLVFAVACMWAAEGDFGITALGVVLALVFVGLTVLMFSPFGMYPTGGSDFHKWKPKQGEVTNVGKRLVSSGKDSMEDKIVITFKGSNQQYGVTDTRAALVKEGDTLVLKCKKAYDWGSIPGYDCKFIQWIPKGGTK